MLEYDQEMRTRAIVMALCLIALSGCDDASKNAGAWNVPALQSRVDALEAEVNSLRVDAARLRASVNACFLDSVKGVTEPRSVASIKQACIRLHERPLSGSMGGGNLWFGPIYGQLPQYMTGLTVQLNLAGAYTVTELTLSIEDKKSKRVTEYTVTRFPAPRPSNILLVQPSALEADEIELTPGLHTFTVPIAETASDQNTFFETYNVGIVWRKGYAE